MAQVMIVGSILSQMSPEVIERIEQSGFEIISVDDTDEEIERVRRIVVENNSERAQRIGDELLVLARQVVQQQETYSELWQFMEPSFTDRDFLEPVQYKMPKYKAPQRAVTRPRQSVMRGK